jgi:arginyl-tRNA synthetase
MDIKSILSQTIVDGLGGEIKAEEFFWEHPTLDKFGDYSTNIVLLKKGGSELAKRISEAVNKSELVSKAEIAGPGFVNVWLADKVWLDNLNEIIVRGARYGGTTILANSKIMVEYAHPNTHKEMHIGHMRTLITGESIARILQKNGATVFRANYQGDIGPHVAKAIWGTQKIVSERGLSWEDAGKIHYNQKAHLLGEGYVLGSKEYENSKDEIDKLNKDLYERKVDVMGVYNMTRQWSLDYYKSFYDRFGTKFDRLFFESEVAEQAKILVQENEGKVFERSDGAIIFDGEKYGLHKRVFLTKDDNPTYEGKEMALGYLQYKTFPFDRCIHVVANEQSGYFSVVIKALEMMDKLFAGKEYHLPMGMVNLVGRKMASRTGDILTVDSLIDEIKSMARGLIRFDGVMDHEIEEISEAVALAAIKYSVLKTNPELNVAFDPKQSVSLDGSSGPYLQYTYARCRSVLAKAKTDISQIDYSTYSQLLLPEERQVLSRLFRYREVVEEAGLKLSPNLIAGYLHDLASVFNNFYNQHSILAADNSGVIEFRLGLTEAVAQVIANGLDDLGIKTIDRM